MGEFMLRLNEKNVQRNMEYLQKNLFGEIEYPSISIELASQRACVSTATIRNWIKTGYLVQTQRGCISEQSLTEFLDNVAGTEKLTARANKSQKDSCNQDYSNLYFANIVTSLHGECLGEAYEKSLTNSYKNKEGIYYTPPSIVKNMFQGIAVDKSLTFLDPCCGSGNFIMEAIKQGVSPQNVYGFDIDANAVEITKKRIFEATGVNATNIKVGDFLVEANKLIIQGVCFDLILTNPPWGKKLSKLAKDQFSQLYKTRNSVDTTALFFFASLQLLKEGGYLGFLVQEAFFNISSYESVRRRVLSCEICRLVDYGKPFTGLITKALGVIIKNTQKQNAIIECESIDTSHKRSRISFTQTPKSIFNIWATEAEASIINKIYSLPHTTLEGKAKWALGIVTGNNAKHCISHPKDNYIPIFKGADITKSGIKKPSTYILNNFDKFQQVAPRENYDADEKIIYRFISSNLVFFYDDCQRLVLNSANILIPFKSLGISLQQLVDLFNSDMMNWLFCKLFNTHKILRGDLELLPIHLEYFIQQPIFSAKSYMNYLGIEKKYHGSFRIKE